MSEKPDIDAIKARLAAAADTSLSVQDAIHASEVLSVHAPTDIAALLAEVERLKARLTITDELLKTAARAAREAAGVNSKTMRNLREHYLDSWMTVTRAALLAAGMTDAALDAAEEGRTP